MVLKKRFENGTISFMWLGNQFQHVDKDSAKQDFDVAVKNEFGEGTDIVTDLLKECYGFIVFGFDRTKGKIRYEPLYNGQMAWILSPDGQEFADISSRQ